MKTKIEKTTKDNIITFTCTTEQKEKLFEMANRSGRTMSGYIRRLIEEEIKKMEATNDRI